MVNQVNQVHTALLKRMLNSLSDALCVNKHSAAFHSETCGTTTVCDLITSSALFPFILQPHLFILISHSTELLVFHHLSNPYIGNPPLNGQITLSGFQFLTYLHNITEDARLNNKYAGWHS